MEYSDVTSVGQNRKMFNVELDPMMDARTPLFISTEVTLAIINPKIDICYIIYEPRD